MKQLLRLILFIGFLLPGNFISAYAHPPVSSDYQIIPKTAVNAVSTDNSARSNITLTAKRFIRSTHSVNNKDRRRIKATNDEEEEEEQLSIKKNRNNAAPAISGIYANCNFTAAFYTPSTDFCSLYNKNRTSIDRRLSCISPNKLFITFQVFRI